MRGGVARSIGQRDRIRNRAVAQARQIEAGKALCRRRNCARTSDVGAAHARYGQRISRSDLRSCQHGSDASIVGNVHIALARRNRSQRRRDRVLGGGCRVRGGIARRIGQRNGIRNRAVAQAR